MGKAAAAGPAKIRHGASWLLRYNDDGIGLGLISPDLETAFVVEPAGTPANSIAATVARHFASLAGVIDGEPAEAMSRLQRS